MSGTAFAYIDTTEMKWTQLIDAGTTPEAYQEICKEFALALLDADTDKKIQRMTCYSKSGTYDMNVMGEVINVYLTSKVCGTLSRE